MTERPHTRRRLWTTRIIWMISIWAASIGALSLAAYTLRLVMNWVGMTA